MKFIKGWNGRHRHCGQAKKRRAKARKWRREFKARLRRTVKVTA